MRYCLVAILSLLSCSAQQLHPTTAAKLDHTSGPAHSLAVQVGSRYLGDGAYDAVNDQRTLGVDYAFERPGDLAGIELAMFWSGDDDERGTVDMRGRTGELALGARRTFEAANVRPYVGMGLALIRTDLEVTGGLDENGGSAAVYVHAGLDLPISSSLFVGCDARALFGSDIKYSTMETDADYAQVSVRFGVRF